MNRARCWRIGEMWQHGGLVKRLVGRNAERLEEGRGAEKQLKFAECGARTCARTDAKRQVIALLPIACGNQSSRRGWHVQEARRIKFVKWTRRVHARKLLYCVARDAAIDGERIDEHSSAFWHSEPLAAAVTHCDVARCAMWQPDERLGAKSQHLAFNCAQQGHAIDFGGLHWACAADGDEFGVQRILKRGP